MRVPLKGSMGFRVQGFRGLGGFRVYELFF